MDGVFFAEKPLIFGAKNYNFPFVVQVTTITIIILIVI
jgi:hypothetical protein